MAGWASLCFSEIIMKPLDFLTHRTLITAGIKESQAGFFHLQYPSPITAF